MQIFGLLVLLSCFSAKKANTKGAIDAVSTVENSYLGTEN